MRGLRDYRTRDQGAATRGARRLRNHHNPRLREAALKRGYRSWISLPLIVRDKVIGVMTLYAGEPGVFDAAETKLLSELAADVSFTVDYIEKEKEIHRLAYFDPLTSLPNAALFLDRCEQALRTAMTRGRHVAVLIMDLERFGRINETHGRSGGDAVLRAVAGRLTALFPDSTVARLGSDNFAIVLTDMRADTDALRVFDERIVPAVSAPLPVDGTELRLTARAGIAVSPADGTDAQTLLLRAETALNRAKQHHDRCLFYEPAMNARIAERLTLESKLRVALDKEQFVLHYQPKFDLLSKRMTGLEALIRWKDPDAGLVSPAAFIPVLEETGMILEAGEWAMRKAASEFQKWRANGLEPPRIAVNVSIISLAHALELRVVAEGVETSEQDKLLTLLKCDEAQGYLYGRPVPADEIVTMLGHRDGGRGDTRESGS